MAIKRPPILNRIDIVAASIYENGGRNRDFKTLTGMEYREVIYETMGVLLKAEFITPNAYNKVREWMIVMRGVWEGY